ncbi:MAG: Rpn family recombination-promoting nuclease/putative transposase [Fibrobacter sp.]|nr:Rpn family recombination-promoting nuclease/putative transposase [Fibrobacter sp.]
MNKKKTKNMKPPSKRATRRKHDPFFRYIYAIPENTRTLLRLAQCRVPELRRMLSSVDMQSLELIPGSFSNVKEWGQSDLAFKAKFKDGSEFFVGILLEHKSYRKSDVLSQIYEYTFEVMVNKNATDFRWLQTKTIIIYNGQSLGPDGGIPRKAQGMGGRPKSSL